MFRTYNKGVWTPSLLLATAVSLGCSQDNSTPTALAKDPPTDVAATEASAAVMSPAVGLLNGGKPRVFRLKGTADVDVIGESLCYTVDLWDIAQDRIVGSATDCLSEIDTSDPTGVVLTGTTTFDLGKGNSFTSRGRTTVRPTMPGSSLAFTHITGAVPAEGSNGVITGTGRFSDFQATVRLSGAVNLTAFPATATFDCLFTVMPL
jgi:hypothetical protein